jgi:hypothetical protein
MLPMEILRISYRSKLFDDRDYPLNLTGPENSDTELKDHAERHPLSVDARQKVMDPLV